MSAMAEPRTHTITVGTSPTLGGITWTCITCDVTDCISYNGWQTYANAIPAAIRHVQPGEAYMIHGTRVPIPEDVP